MRKEAVRKRRWAPKVRTGCKTCKIRRKKCDEAKPHCLRCIKDRFTCEGYSQPRAWTFSPPAKSDSDSTPPVSSITTPEPLTQVNTPTPDCCIAAAEVQVRQTWSRSGIYDLGSNGFLLEPGTAWTAETDRSFCQFFLLRFAPVLSTTSQWQYFWNTVVPQAAWDHPAVNHAMVAVAASYESRLSRVDRTRLVLSRSNLAIRAFRAQSSSLDVTLIVCRLFAALSQFRGDFRMATMHMNNGQRIFQEAAQSGKRVSDIIRNMAPTFLALSTEAIDDAHFYMRTPPDKWSSFEILKTLRSDYGRLLYSMTADQWRKFEVKINGLLSIAWSTLTQAFSSMIYPNIVYFTSEDPITPVAEIIMGLHATDELMSLEHLRTEFALLIQDLQAFIDPLEKRGPYPAELRTRLKRCVENYIVQAAKIEPKMSAGTFWNDHDQPHCAIEWQFQEGPLNRDGYGSEGKENLEVKSFADAPAKGPEKKILNADFELKKRGYYLEHVCHYRSGFIPSTPTVAECS